MNETKPEFYAILTDAGKELQFECLNSDKKFIMSEIAVGDGNGSYYEPERTQTTIKNECYRHTITRTITDKAGQVKSVILDIPEDINGFTIREAGIYGKDGNLLVVAKYPATPLLNPESGAVIQQAIKIDLAQNNEIVLPVLIDPSINTASVEYVEKHFQKLEEKAQPNGYPSLDEYKRVPSEQLPLFVRGCINSGPVDVNGEPAILTYDETTRIVTVNAPFLFTTHSGKTYECKENLTAVVDENVKGTVRFWVAKGSDGAFFVEPLINNIYKQKPAPENPQENDVWVDISIAPQKALRLVNGAWQIYEGVEIGALHGGTVTTYSYNVSSYLNKYEFENFKTTNTADLNGKADVDFSNVTKPYVVEEVTRDTSWYRIWSNGYKEQKGVTTCGSAYSGYGVIVDYAIPFETELKYGNFDYQNVVISQVGTAVTVLVPVRYFSTKEQLHIISGQTNTPTYSWYASGY